MLPYKEGISSDQVLRKFNLPEECFPVIQNERRIDMILGAQDMRQFKLLETCKWQEGLSHGPLVEKHSLGPIYWGVKINDGCNPYICAVQRDYKPYYVDQILEVVLAEHNISANECLEYISGLIQNISHYYKDQLIIDPISEKLIISREDEQILFFLRRKPD